MNRNLKSSQTLLGIFLLGIAALAVFDFWFPGILLLIGAMLLLDKHRYGWGFILLGGVFWLRDFLGQFDIPNLFALVMIAMAVLMLTTVDLSRFFKQK